MVGHSTKTVTTQLYLLVPKIGKLFFFLDKLSFHSFECIYSTQVYIVYHLRL